MGTDANVVKTCLRIASDVQADVGGAGLPASETQPGASSPVLPRSLYLKTRGYVEKIAIQINRTYEETCYDASAVMLRRLLEILIIETFEAHGLADAIKGGTGDYLYLSDLIDRLLAHDSWNLSRNSKASLQRVKTLGDQSAHSRRYNARREYIDEQIVGVRTIVEELLYLSRIRT